jgi:hypothetical protein
MPRSGSRGEMMVERNSPELLQIAPIGFAGSR